MEQNREMYYTKLHQLASAQGMALFGVADVRQARSSFLIPPAVAGKLDYGISIGYRLSSSILETIEGAPTQMYYFHYQRANILLDQTTLLLTARIQEQGFNALPIPASQVVDWERQLGSVSHREIARLAGHGWYGRNNLMVNPLYGSQVRYGTVLTDMPLKADAPYNGNGCDTCTACVKMCPCGAIEETNFVLERCQKQLKEFIKTQKIGQMICGVCVKACRGSKGL